MADGSSAEAPDLAVRRRPVQQRGIARFDTILIAARVLLASEGVEGFTIEDVAARAGIPIGSVYQYFPNKFAIVAELDARDTEALIGESGLALHTRRTSGPVRTGTFPTSLLKRDWAVTCTRNGCETLRSLATDPSRVHLSYHGLDLSRFSAFDNRIHARDGVIRPHRSGL